MELIDYLRNQLGDVVPTVVVPSPNTTELTPQTEPDFTQNA